MNDSPMLYRVINMRRRLNARDVVATSTRHDTLKLLDDLVPYLAHPAQIVEQPAQSSRGIQYGIVQYPGDKMLWGPSNDPIALLKAMGKFDPDAVKIVQRETEKAPWQQIA